MSIAVEDSLHYGLEINLTSRTTYVLILFFTTVKQDSEIIEYSWIMYDLTFSSKNVMYIST